jgi:hypothetical protein
MFGKKTVDSVLASFRKTIAELQAIEKASQMEADRLGSAIANAKFDRDTAIEEANRAAIVAGKIESLIS